MIIFISTTILKFLKMNTLTVYSIVKISERFKATNILANNAQTAVRDLMNIGYKYSILNSEKLMELEKAYLLILDIASKTLTENCLEYIEKQTTLLQTEEIK